MMVESSVDGFSDRGSTPLYSIGQKRRCEKIILVFSWRLFLLLFFWFCTTSFVFWAHYPYPIENPDGSLMRPAAVSS